MAVGAGARAAAPRLDPEQVVEERDDVVVVQVTPVPVANHEGDDAEPLGLPVAEDLDPVVLGPRGDGPADEALLPLPDALLADRLLELEHDAAADGADDVRRPPLLAVLGVLQVALHGRVHVPHRAAPGDDRNAVGEQGAARHEHTGGARPADELVRREEDGVLVVQLGALPAPGPHLDLHVGGRGGEVPEGERPVLVEEGRYGRHVGDDAGDVGGGREGADLEWPVGVAAQLLLQVIEVDAAVQVLVDGDHVGDRLPPGEVIRVVLVGTHEHHGTRFDRDVVGEAVALVQVVGDPEVEDADQLVDGGRGARAGEHDRVLVGLPSHRLEHDGPRLLAEARGLEARPGTLGVGVGVQGQDRVADPVLDEGEGPSGGGVVRVGDAPRAPGADDRLVAPDHRGPDVLDESVTRRGREALEDRGGGAAVRHTVPSAPVAAPAFASITRRPLNVTAGRLPARGPGTGSPRSASAGSWPRCTRLRGDPAGRSSGPRPSRRW